MKCPTKVQIHVQASEPWAWFMKRGIAWCPMQTMQRLIDRCDLWIFQSPIIAYDYQTRILTCVFSECIFDFISFILYRNEIHIQYFIHVLMAFHSGNLLFSPFAHLISKHKTKKDILNKTYLVQIVNFPIPTFFFESFLSKRRTTMNIMK